MLEEFLDEDAQKMLNRIEQNPKDEMTLVPDQPLDLSPRSYDPSKLSVKLPGTDFVEKIEYLPPTLPLFSQEYKNSEPKFLYSKPRFDIFEHFQVEWIKIPDLEDD